MSFGDDRLSNFLKDEIIQVASSCPCFSGIVFGDAELHVSSNDDLIEIKQGKVCLSFQVLLDTNHIQSVALKKWLGKLGTAIDFIVARVILKKAQLL